MNLRLVFAGAGAVGASAALLVANALPGARITVLDAGPPKHAGSRTFVLSSASYTRLAEQGLDEILAPAAHSLRRMRTSFTGSFGTLTLSGADIMTQLIGRTFIERELVDAVREALLAAPNVEVVSGAQVSAVQPGRNEAVVAWNGGKNEISCDLAAVAGLPRSLLEQSGFKWNIKKYSQEAAIADIRGGSPGDTASERLTVTGAMTLVPHRAGWGHIWLDCANTLSALRREPHANLLRTIENEHGIELGSGAKIETLASFRPVLATAAPAAARRVVLLGGSACSVHPIGAQELNLGLRDGLTLASSLADMDGRVPASFAEDFAMLRSADRAHIAKITNFAAMATECRVPGKLAAAGVCAFIAGLLPPLRKRILSAWVLHG